MVLNQEESGKEAFMSNMVREKIFEARKEDHYNPLLAGVRGTYLFDIKDSGCWHVTVEDGRIHTKESNEPAQCGIKCEEEDFINIVEGRQNLTTAWMQGRVQITGDAALAQKFHGFIGAQAEEQKGAQRRVS
jgi:putative sterol carrier protein